MTKKNIVRASAVGLSLCLFAAAVPTTGVQAKAKMKLNKKKITVTVGSKTKLTVKNAGKKKVTWKSSNKKVVKVNKKGLVKAKKAGKATITAKIGKKTFKCKVTVKGGLNKTSVTMKKGDSTTLKLTGAKKVTWSSSNSSVVSVKKKGKKKATITAVKKGTATITAKSGGKKYTCKVTVKGSGNGSAQEQEQARREQVEKQVDTKLTNAVNSVTTPQMKDQEKALRLAYYVCDNLTHYYGNYYAESDVDSIRCIEGGKGTDLGYAEIYGSLLDKVGIENFYVPANSGGFRSKIKIDGEWYNVDVYHMDPDDEPSGSRKLNYGYFMFSDQEAFKYHSDYYYDYGTVNGKYPYATSTRYDFVEKVFNDAKADGFSKLGNEASTYRDVINAFGYTAADYSTGDAFYQYNPWYTGQWVNY